MAACGWGLHGRARTGSPCSNGTRGAIPQQPLILLVAIAVADRVCLGSTVLQADVETHEILSLPPYDSGTVLHTFDPRPTPEHRYVGAFHTTASCPAASSKYGLGFA